MWVRPTLVSSSHGRRNINSSNYFILQANDSTRHHKSTSAYRVITKQFPHYKVSEGNEYSEIDSNFEYLNAVVVPSIQGKISSKVLARWLKTWYDSRFSEEVSHSREKLNIDAASTDDEASSLSQYYISKDLKSSTPSFSDVGIDAVAASDGKQPTQGNLNTNISSISLPNISEEKQGVDSAYIPVLSAEPNTRPQMKRLPPSSLQHEQSISAPSDHSLSSLDDLDNEEENWWSKQGLGVLGHWFESPVPNKARKNQGQNYTSFKDIPIQFIALLTYPEIDSATKKKLTYADLKEIGRVKSRRKVLLFLTTYTFVVRWCSFDLFLIILFLANCAILFLMKNSGKVNMQMAKRSVRQRANYMKQWAGGFFKKNGGNAHPSSAYHTPNASSVQVNKALSSASSDLTTNGKKHKKLFAKKGHSQGNSIKSEGKPKKLFRHASSKRMSNSMPLTLSNCSEPELNSVQRGHQFMSIDNSSF
ncbi:hypothetical protein K493DRAFT_336814 [Basidiobolus meristosporus CBS 931.73]|uniref:Uncharacterized protein n=1 Tax=Basidiobolus meristosporus CBS 931.73 TaxID=1314790 RepID=A0A1Y1YG06_9FUNG|nr:hypothetical protein K493DRAFT_336814 [Basidiobolus meristosporus CBS 931.73]|eukprot:ORX96656.1 hypothetical protein K493DRAFT_336814 [Basidiobolus meristosporus CBS 931.73]